MPQLRQSHHPAPALALTGVLTLAGLTGCGPESTGPDTAATTRTSRLVTLGGDTTCAPGSPDCNLCVPNVPA
ncbi:MAG TPA: hypothetical protein VE153_38500, partial [Myxococcus sp.]|nr:hypothetical protein [Myxococcus sp.]